ncbi:glycerophosphodiester phosphodiesterase [Bifidobacterium aemilianum]|uniref:Glycerophosphodiester phosphodiesterase n=1 Tax=Bifidobacterium aemilianum TaxID=2493120 RepID=A0A366K840_9BIFI|nr:glycerophosphodiester phosphodiesterase [Bifidobacterium aemilianum]RBP97896.1 glycerophosphodiester phosphodiesterase [Bifidobacterium aemilianum]
MGADKVIVVDTSIFKEDAAAKTAAANKVAKEMGISEAELAQVEGYKAELTKHNAWDLPFMGYVNEDGYGYAYVPDQAIAPPNWDAHKAFKDLPDNVQTAFAIRMLFTHRDVDRYGANMFLHYDRGITVRFEGPGSNNY